MRTKIATIVVLAALLATATALAGANMAGADQVAEGTSLGGSTTVPEVATAPAATVPACSNGVDDDGDGLVDMEDPDCESPTDTTEEPTFFTPPSAEAPSTPTTPSDPARRRKR